MCNRTQTSLRLSNAKEVSMSRHTLLRLVVFTVVALLTTAAAASAQTLFEGARLITGDGSVIENSAFVVTGNQISQVGRKGEVSLPANGKRVDLTGKTVMPALIDAHV